MAVYKVPQDVEAEDKLLGPFSFRQFIYLIVSSISLFLAYLLSKVLVGLLVLPLPIALFFLILALPLKKDQPMETYLAAIVRFLLKPRRRLWDPEGEISLVEITTPKINEGPVLKNFSGQEASQRLQYISNVIDTGGWAVRGLTSPLDNVSLDDTLVAEAQSAEDIMDSGGIVSQNIDTMITESDQTRRQEMILSMQQNLQAQASTPTSTSPPDATNATAVKPEEKTATTKPDSNIVFNPYPSSIRQKVIRPTTATQPKPQQSTEPAKLEENLNKQNSTKAQASSENSLSPDIIRLATNKDLSISTIAREAERINKRHLDESKEVIVSLR